MKNGFLFIIALFVWLIGTLGAAGYLLYIGEKPCAIAVLGNGVLAYPTVKKLFEKLKD